MAIINTVLPDGEPAMFDIPDADLAKYRLQTQQMTDEVRAKLFPGKEKMVKEDAHGVLPAGPAPGGDVQGYAAWCYYWYYSNGWYYWWYDYC